MEITTYHFRISFQDDENIMELSNIGGYMLLQ